MPKMSQLDEQIVRLLEVDGRLTSIKLGEALNVSPSTIRHRLTKLLSSGMVTITARVNPAKVGLEVVSLIALDIVQGKVASAAKQLDKYQEVKWIDYRD